jgi:hypothetical protein
MADDHTRKARGLDPATVRFPNSGYFGVAAEFAELFSQSYESPKEFLYLDCLTLIGASVSGRVRADFDLPVQPRLYVLKVAKSAWRRKSTSTRLAERFVQNAAEEVSSLDPCYRAKVIYGVGSAEGLGHALKPSKVRKQNAEADHCQFTKRAILSFDEFRRFEAKAGIRSSVLLPMVNELYESNQFDNLTNEHPFQIQDGHLSFLSNTTEETFKNMLNAPEFRDLGFFNRLFTVVSDSRKRIAKPKAPPEDLQGPIRAKLAGYFAALPQLNDDGSATKEIVIPLSPEAERKWEKWYRDLPETEETARLDNLGMRLMGLLAFSDGRSEIDEESLQSVLDILEYQRQVRLLYRPIEAENPSARMEQKILRAIRQHGPLSRRELYKRTHAERDGVRILTDAMRSLTQESVGISPMIVFEPKEGKFHLVEFVSD